MKGLGLHHSKGKKTDVGGRGTNCGHSLNELFALLLIGGQARAQQDGNPSSAQVGVPEDKGRQLGRAGCRFGETLTFHRLPPS